MGMTKAEEAQALKSNMDCVRATAQKFLGYGIDRKDLEQEAAIGFLRGIRKWDPNGGSSLRSYASQWARDAVQQALGYVSETGKYASRVDETSLDERSSDECGSGVVRDLHDVLPSSTFESPEDIAIRNERVQITLDAIEALQATPAELAIIRGNILCDGTLEDVGADVGISRSHAHRVRGEIVELVASVAGAAA